MNILLELYPIFGSMCLVVTLIGWISEEDEEKNDNVVVFGLLATIFNPLVAIAIALLGIYGILLFIMGIVNAFKRTGKRLKNLIETKFGEVK